PGKAQNVDFGIETHALFLPWSFVLGHLSFPASSGRPSKKIIFLPSWRRRNVDFSKSHLNHPAFLKETDNLAKFLLFKLFQLISSYFKLSRTKFFRLTQFGYPQNVGSGIFRLIAPKMPVIPQIPLSSNSSSCQNVSCPSGNWTLRHSLVILPSLNTI